MPKAKAWRTMGPALAALSLCACQHGSDVLDEEALARQLRSLASLSSEAAFLTQELRAGHLKATFVAAHLQDLSADAIKAQHEIAKPAQSMLGSQHAAAQALAAKLAEQLRNVALAQAGPDERLEGEQQALTHLKTEFEALEKSL